MTDDRQAIFDRIRARASGSLEQSVEDRLSAWIAADLATGAPEWGESDKDEARAWLKEHPDFSPLVAILAKFGGYKNLFRRYESLLGKLVRDKLLSAEDAETSKQITKNYSVAGLIQEGKLLKAWAEPEVSESPFPKKTREAIIEPSRVNPPSQEQQATSAACQGA